MGAQEQKIPKGAERLSDLPEEKDVEAAIAAWRAGASRTLVEAVGGREAIEEIERGEARAAR